MLQPVPSKPWLATCTSRESMCGWSVVACGFIPVSQMVQPPLSKQRWNTYFPLINLTVTHSGSQWQRLHI